MPTERNGNILLVSLRADVGGGPKAMLMLAENLAKRNWNVFCASPDEEPYFEKFKEVSKDILIMPKRKFKLSSLVRLVRFIKSKKISIIHSHGKGAGVYSRLAGLITGTKVVHHFHGIHIPRTPLSKLLYLNIERLFSKITDAVVCVSESEKQKALSLKIAPENKVEVIPNGIDFSQIKEKKHTDWEQKFKTIIFVGRLDIFHKGIDRALKTIQRIVKNQPEIEFEFFIVGDGEDRRKVEEMIKEMNLENRVKLLGQRDDVPELLVKSYLFFSMARWEGLPFAVAEAMATGLPSVLSNVEGHKDLARDGLTGFLVNDEQEAEKKLVFLLKNTETAELMGRNARRTVMSIMSVPSMIKKTEQIYLKVLSK